MPCNSDYMDPHTSEINYSQVLCLLEEVNGKKWSKDNWRGWHPLAYQNTTKEKLDKATAELCRKLTSLKDVSSFSLELQMWWRDHQKADKERQETEKKKLAFEKVKKQALSKLSLEEKKALGLK